LRINALIYSSRWCISSYWCSL